ncbi:MAG: ribosome silencing factor [Pseudomonadota bacterium]
MSEGASRLSQDPAVVAEQIVTALEDAKAQNIRKIDVRGHTSMTDFMIVASGTSDRHVKSVAGNLVETMKKAGLRPLGVEGENDGEWVLVDLQDALVHVMLPRVREFYNLEKLWDIAPAVAADDSDAP